MPIGRGELFALGHKIMTVKPSLLIFFGLTTVMLLFVNCSQPFAVNAAFDTLILHSEENSEFIPIGPAHYLSANMSSNSDMKTVLANTPTYNNIPELRFEFRLSGFSATGAIGSVGAFYLAVTGPNQIRITNWHGNGESITLTFPANAKDIFVRVQRSVATHKWSVQSWSADGAQRLAFFIGSEAVTDSVNLSTSDGILVGRTTSQWAWLRVFNTTLPLDAPPPSNISSNAILNYEFEGNGEDSSGNKQHLTLSGNPTFINTPVVPLLGEMRTVRAGKPFTLDCYGTDASAYSWQQISGPSTLSFSSPTAGRTLVSGADRFGEYQVQCKATVQPSNLAGTTILKLGAVESTESGIVIPPSATLSMLLGPMLRANVTDWTWYDRTRRETGEYWASATQDYSKDMISREAENYYDSALVQYQNYYRTGLNRHLVLARAIADKFYDQFIKPEELRGNCASNFSAPRDAALVGLIIRATETGSANTWKCLTDYTSYALNLWVELRIGARTAYYGTREGGYALIFATAIAASHPDATVRSDMASRVARSLTRYFRTIQCLEGDTRAECRANYTTGIGSISVVKGSSTVTGSNTAFSSFLRAGNWIAFKSAATGDNYSLPILRVDSDSSLTLSAPYVGESVVTNANEWAKDTQDGLRPGGFRFADPSSAGVLGWHDQVWHSAILMEGVARAYRQGIEPTVAKSIIVDYANYLLNEPRVYLLAACPFDTNVRIKGHSYLTFSLTGDWTGTESCSSASALKDIRATNNTVALVYGQAYFLTGETRFLTRGDEVFSATFANYSGPGHDFFSGLADSTYNSGKQYGQSFRSSGWYLVDRLGPR